MEPNQVEYYRVEKLGGEQYFAAKSREAVLEFIGSPEDSTSNASLFGYRLDTLERVAEEEARKTPYFKAFAEDFSLCADGTFVLGIPNVKPTSKE